MAFDPNMGRWIMASCRTWFEANKQNNIPIFYEYTESKNITINDTVVPATQYGEFRLNGPDYRQVTQNEAWYDVGVNVLLTQILQIGNADTVELLISSIYICFTTMIPIYRYGDATNILNDGSLVGCMFISEEKDGEVNVYRFGQANPDTKLSQTSIEAGYRLKIQL